MKSYKLEEKYISLVFYLRNGDKYILESLYYYSDFFSKKFKNIEYIIVDDFSKDDSIKIVKTFFEERKVNGTIICLSWSHGVEMAMRAGLEKTIGDFVFEIDTPYLKVDYSDLYRMYQLGTSQYDIVRLQSIEPFKSTPSKIFYTILDKADYGAINLTSDILKIVSRRAINRLLEDNHYFKYRKLLYNVSGLSNILIKPENAILLVHKGKNILKKNNLFEQFNNAITILVYYTNSITNLSFGFAIFFSILSFLLGVYAIFIFFTLSEVQKGWTTIMLFLSLCFSGVFFLFFLQAKYLNIILNEVYKKKKYTYNEIVTYNSN